MLKTLLAAAALTLGLGASSAVAAPAPLAAQPALLGEAAVGDLVDVHYRKRRHHHRRHYRPRSGFSVELQFGSPRYRHVPRYRHAPRYRYAPVARYGARHHAWCEGKYRSYRRFDGTFQPYHGSRRRCNSPYDGI